MITVKIEGELAAFTANMEKQVKFAAAKALTRTAQAVQRAIPAELDKALDRPTEFTKRGTYMSPAKRDNLVAVVGFKDKQARYMRYQVEGGTRSPTARGIKLPGNVVLDQHGNIPRGLIAKLIAAAQSGKYGAGVKKRLGINGKGNAPANLSLFYGQPKNRPDLPVGIYRRIGSGIVPVVVFSQKPAKYQPRFKFKELAERVVRDTFAKEFDAALDDAMRTAR